MKASYQIGSGEPAILENDNDEMSLVEGKQLEKRAERNSLLALSDSMVLPDRGFTDSTITKWKAYRQSLRDLDFSDPDNIIWPTKPE